VSDQATEERPVYTKLAQERDGATQLWMIGVDEGWRTFILCQDMYEWAADWLLGVLGRQPVTHSRSGVEPGPGDGHSEQQDREQAQQHGGDQT
jgi:hypothetical protein